MAFAQSLQVQRRVLGALLAREIHEGTGRGAYKLLLAIAEPIAAVSIAIIWHTLLRIQPPYGSSRVLFITTGLYPTYVFVHISCEFRSLSKSSFASRRYPVETMLDQVLVASFIKTVLYAVIGFIGFAIIYNYFTPDAWPTDWTLVLQAFVALSSLALGVGICNAAVEQLIPVWRHVWNPIARGLILFSGVIYVPDFLPRNIRDFLSWNPVLQGVELFRQGFYLNYPKTCYSGFYLWSCVAGLILMGLAFDRVFRTQLDEI